MAFAPCSFQRQDVERELLARFRVQFARVRQQSLALGRKGRFEFSPRRCAARLAQPLIAPRQHRSEQSARGLKIIIEMCEQSFSIRIGGLKRERTAGCLT